MAGTVVTTEIVHGSVKKITFAWTSDASGDVNGTATTHAYDGRLIAVTTDPGATAPTDNYDLELRDADGVDVLLGQGANRDTANTEYLLEATLGAVASSKLTLVITSAGSAKQGTVVVWLR